MHCKFTFCRFGFIRNCSVAAGSWVAVHMKFVRHIGDHEPENCRKLPENFGKLLFVVNRGSDSIPVFYREKPARWATIFDFVLGGTRKLIEHSWGKITRTSDKPTSECHNQGLIFLSLHFAEFHSCTWNRKTVKSWNTGCQKWTWIFVIIKALSSQILQRLSSPFSRFQTSKQQPKFVVSGTEFRIYHHYGVKL